ncbi:unnamed protein product, partial [marine sediment metagenome]
DKNKITIRAPPNLIKLINKFLETSATCRKLF